MTVGPVGASLLRLTLPMLGALLATIGYSVAETWFIARLGPHALAAVSLAVYLLFRCSARRRTCCR